MLSIEQVRELREELEKKSPNFSTPIDPREVWDTLEAALKVVEAAKVAERHIGRIWNEATDPVDIPHDKLLKIIEDAANIAHTTLEGALQPFTAKTGEA